MRFTLGLLFAALALGQQSSVRIALAGDSTVNDEGGWGPGFRASFGSPVEVLNFAKNGRSSKSFRDEGLWEPLLASKPNYVFVQFGHNDQPGKGPERETVPSTTFGANINLYVDEVKAIGAIPVLVTSIVRRNFDEAGTIKRDGLVPYVSEIRKIAGERNVPLIDLYALTLAKCESLGPAATAALGAKAKDGKLDTTHLSRLGQREIGVMAAREAVRLFPALQPYHHELIEWKNAMRQPRSWYGSVEAIRVANNLLFAQHANGGWDKNIDMALPMVAKAVQTTIDNGATYTQMRFLARVFAATQDQPFALSFKKGLDYLLAAQYSNGGWPQFFPLRKGYYTHITYNDDAMIGVMETLRSVANKEPDYAFASEYSNRCAAAISKGIECILKTQVIQNGKLTVWCAQHDENTFAPAKARSYELPSLSGGESVGIVRFLMSLERPSPAIVASIQGAIAWFEASKITGIRVDRKPETIVVADPGAAPLWARFYDLNTNEPIFSGRDGVIKHTLAEIEYERRNGYRWYGDSPAHLLDTEYPKWRAQQGL